MKRLCCLPSSDEVILYLPHYTTHSTNVTSMAPPRTGAAALMVLLGLLVLSSRVSTAFQAVRAGFKPLAATSTTRLHAHSHLHAALHLMRQQGPSQAGGGPRAPPPPALSVHFASNPDPTEDVTGTGDKVRVLKHQQSDHSAAASVTSYLEIQLPTKEGISLHDITPQLRQAITEAGVQEGWVNVVSRHTTTAVTLNECESRLMDDVRQFLLKLAPPSYPYLHNDIHLRPATEDDKRRVGDWDLDEWRAQEPKNCHSHLLSMLLGNTLMLPVTEGKLAIGRWQSVMMVELDGPRERTVGIQVVGFKR